VRAAHLSLLDAERCTLVGLRNHCVIGDQALRRVQRDLDMDEVRLSETSG
jgi:hypothetical protein